MPVRVTSQTIADYLEDERAFKTYQSYTRVGRQIVKFVNRYLTEPVHLIQGIGYQLKIDNVNMPIKYVSMIHTWLQKRASTLKSKLPSIRNEREMSKILGKSSHLIFHQLTEFFAVSAVTIALHTGCRPSEAAYIVLNKSIETNDYLLKHQTYEQRATAPKEFTKTSYDYFWLLPEELNPFILILKNLD